MSNVCDLILKGTILTFSNQTPVVEAVAVKDGLIIGLGAIDDIGKLAGPGTEFLDLTGKAVLPGFIDTHVHAGFTGASDLSVNLEDAVSIDDILERLRIRISATPAGELVYATRFNYSSVAERRMPSRAELDRLTASHPIAIHNMDGHSVMLNSILFRQLDLSVGDPGVDTDEKAKPTGLIEDPAIAQVFSLFSPSEESKLLPLLQATVNAALEAGITTIHMKELPACLEIAMANESQLPIRIKPFFLFTEKNFHALDKLIDAGKFRDRAIIGFIADGSPDSQTAAYCEPYPGDEKNYGVLFYSDEQLAQVVGKAHRCGYQVSVHACGNRCIEQVLKVYEQVLEDAPRQDHRHRIEHFETPSASQILRAARTGICASMHPQHTNLSAGYAQYMRSVLGERMAERMIPLRSVLDAGMLVAGGSDSPVAPMAPLTAIHDCVHHPNPMHRISLYEALRMLTIDAARIGFEEDMKGSIEKGKLADFVVLSENPYTVAQQNIRDIRIEMTLVGGQTAYTTKQGY